MKQFTFRIGFFLAIDLLLLTLCFLHLPSVYERPVAPFEVTEINDNIVVSRIAHPSSSGGIAPGDRLLTWNTLSIPVPEAIEFLGDMGAIGDEVTVTGQRGGDEFSTKITLLPFYPSPRFPIISLVVGLIIWCMAVFILWNASPGFTAMVLHWTLIAFAVTVLMTLGAVRSEDVLSYIDRLLFFIAYEGVTALFFFFTLLYPIPRARSRLFAAAITFIPALVLVAGLSIFHLSDLRTESLDHFTEFQTLFDFFHVSLFVYVAGALVNIIYALVTARTGEEQRKLQWIVWGLCIGAGPFLFLHVLPQIVYSRYFMAEEYATIFFLAVPFSFAMSFLKYRFLDIEVLINRSIVYAALTIFTIVTFSLAFFLITSGFGSQTRYEEYVAVAGVALGFAFLFSPVRNRLQHLVDETLFAARANFRSAVRGLSDGLHRVLTSDALFQTLVDRLFGLIPLRTIGIYRCENGELVLARRRGESIPGRVALTEEEQRALAEMPVCMIPGTAEGSQRVLKPPLESLLAKIGCPVCASLTDNRGELLGAVVLAPRSPQDRFLEEEIDLLQTGCSQASEILERLMLQERMILEREENRRLQEISEMKSYFVSSVSHELRTPLTSIRMFAEMLKTRRSGSRRQQKEYLDIIEGEAGRLGRLIGNVLDFSKIERGIKEYNFQDVSLKSVVRKAAAALQYEFRSAKARLRVSIGRNLPETVWADPDALEQLLINLLSNALKYSMGKKKLAELSVSRTASHVILGVSDSGIGISVEELPSIFDKFYRVTNGRMKQVGGMGLGLSIVKHIVESHRGNVTVKSKPGKGTTVTVKIPITQHYRDSRRP